MPQDQKLNASIVGKRLPNFFSTKAPLKYSRQLEELMTRYFSEDYLDSMLVRDCLGPVSNFIDVPRADTFTLVEQAIESTCSKLLGGDVDENSRRVLVDMLRYLQQGILQLVSSSEILSNDDDFNEAFKRVDAMMARTIAEFDSKAQSTGPQ